jgi:putative hydrolase of the HAD superfamily
MAVTTVGLDADDTLWHNETVFRLTHARFAELLAEHAEPGHLEERLAATESRNLRIYGYGAKGFTLSMIETALELTDGQAPAAVLREILAAGRDMLEHPVEPLPGVSEALAALAERDRKLVLITKGDLFHQERKLAASGLGELFSGVEIVSEKTPAVYARIFSRYGEARTSVMAGNSVRSDVLPPLEAGAYAALVPYPLVWAHEAADPPRDHPRFAELPSLAELPGWIDTLD